MLRIVFVLVYVKIRWRVYLFNSMPKHCVLVFKVFACHMNDDVTCRVCVRADLLFAHASGS